MSSPSARSSRCLRTVALALLITSQAAAQFPPGGRPGGQRRTGPPPKPSELAIEDGAARIPDRETFRVLSYQGREVMIDTHLAGLEFVKFQIEGAGGDDPQLYFLNTNTHRSHPGFMMAMGIGGMGGGRGGGFGRGNRNADGPVSMRGVLVYRPLLEGPDGSPGYYTFEFEPNDAYPFAKIKLAYDMLTEMAPILRQRLGYRPLPAALEQYEADKAAYEAAALPVFLEKDLFGDIAFLPLHTAVSFGRLRLMAVDERPSPRDIVLYRTLPNEMPRVAGMITAARQTPLSHVNLRAIQDDVPNAFVKGAADAPAIKALIGKYVRYAVLADSYELREATAAEVEAHFADLRPATVQQPIRDVSIKEIRSLDDIEFEDSKGFGVKAANVAVLRTVDLPPETAPEGYAIPFWFYHEFMNHNSLYEHVAAMLAMEGFATDADLREQELATLRKRIKKGDMPAWMHDALTELQRQFGEHGIRCRSSTNNEDLPGFSGAGLYDSFTHRADEGHLSKSIQQVFASLWNFRAFEEREFYRIDHSTTAMGVLVHPNFDDEKANGVAVTDDILYQTREQKGRRYYVNVQVGEDLVTNPDASSVPEELLLSPITERNDALIRTSSRVGDDETILTPDQRDELREALRSIHRRFRRLYGMSTRTDFAIEVEFKITADGTLAIKQARPWVY